MSCHPSGLIEKLAPLESLSMNDISSARYMPVGNVQLGTSNDAIFSFHWFIADMVLPAREGTAGDREIGDCSAVLFS